AGLPVTKVKDRHYFRSIYVTEPGGAILEVATDGPGFTIDEPLDELGLALKLPPWLEPERATLRGRLPVTTSPGYADRWSGGACPGASAPRAAAPRRTTRSVAAAASSRPVEGFARGARAFRHNGVLPPPPRAPTSPEGAETTCSNVTTSNLADQRSPPRMSVVPRMLGWPRSSSPPSQRATPPWNDSWNMRSSPVTRPRRPATASLPSRLRPWRRRRREPCPATKTPSGTDSR